jgi:4-amino-4-deoxy-L-arabinose transferase-like glycosyltransferase
VKRTLDSIRDHLRLRPHAEWLIFAALCAVFCGELFLSMDRLSQTADEPTHLYAGYRYLTCRDLTVSPEHPPLAKIIAAAPLLSMNLAVNCAPFTGDDVAQAIEALNWFYAQNFRSVLARARAAVSGFAVGLCFLVWMAARRMFDLTTAITATALLIFEPNLLALGALVMTDMPVTCMMLFAVFGFYLWARNRTAPFLLLTGLATGLTLLAKHSGLVVVPILCVLAAGDALLHYAGPRLTLQTALRNLLAVALICAVAFGIVWLGYGIRFAAYPGAGQFPGASQEATSKSARVLLALKNYHVLPEAYLEGFARALSISSQSGPAFLAGRIYPHPPWFSVPFLLLIRNTPAMLALFLTAVFGVIIAFGQHRREFLFLLIPAGTFLAVCLRSTIVGGVRYLLPVFPFLLIAAAAGCVELARRVRWVRYAVPCLMILHAASSLHAYPNYLSYANEFWGGPAKRYKYLPWLDSGQAYLEAKAYLERHPPENCWFITDWPWNPQNYGVPCTPFGIYLSTQIPSRVRGTVIVSSTLLTDLRLADGEVAAPFKNLAPKAEIGGGALLVYEGDFDTRPDAAVSELQQTVLTFSAGQTSVALQHGKRAVELAPESAYAHSFICALLAGIGQLDAALNECSMAQNLLLHDPLREEPLRKKYLDSVEATLTLLRAQSKAVHENDAGLAPPAPSAHSR